MNKLKIDLTTGQATAVPLSEIELAARAAEIAAPPPVPASVTMRQLRLWLLQAGKLDQVAAALDAIPDATARAAALIEWEYAITVERRNPLTLAMAATVDMDEAAIDSAFRAAAVL